jgi:cysteine desulfurase
MGIADDLSTCAIRVSLGWSTTEAEVAEFIGKWQDLYRRRGRH